MHSDTTTRRCLRRRAWVAILLTPFGFAALVQTVSPWLASSDLRPFSGFGASRLNATTQFLSALAVLLVSLGALWWVWRQIGTTASVRTLAALGLGILALLTIRTTWAFAYVNYDYASEFLVYAHASPDVRVVMEQVEDIHLLLEHVITTCLREP